ncbi:MAG: hypothetical protein WA060_03665, partial [Minisyncoccia bacterium]
MRISFLQIKNTSLSRKIFVSIFVFLSALSPLFVLEAAINKQINYQGKLTTSAGVAVANGTYVMEFKLYTVPTLGTAIWTETRTGANEVQVTNGLFSVMLGEVTALTGVDFNQTLYLGVKIESDAEMTPRKKLGTVPSAVVAEGALNIIGGGAGTIPYQSAANTTAFSAVGIAGQALISGNTGSPTWFAPTLGSVLFAGANGILSQDNANFFWDDTTNRLGIGTTSPTEKLTVAGGNIVLRENDDGFDALRLDAGAASAAIRGYSNGVQTIEIHTNTGSTSYFNAGNVGIGTTTPTVGKLQLNQTTDSSSGGITVTDSSVTNSLRFWANATQGRIDVASSGVGPLILNSGGGKVGIGNTSPLELLTLGTAGTTAGTLSLAGATSGKATIVVNAVAGTPTLTLPTTTGTLALVSDLTTGYVPYTGATTDVDLGIYQLSTGNLIAGSAEISGLTSGRIPYASTGGLLVDSTGLIYNGTTFGTGVISVTDNRLTTVDTLADSSGTLLSTTYNTLSTVSGAYLDFVYDTTANKKVSAGVTDTGRLVGQRFNVLRNYTTTADNGTLSLLQGMVFGYGHFNSDLTATPTTTTVTGLALAGNNITGAIGTLTDLDISYSGGGTVTTHTGVNIGALTGTTVRGMRSLVASATNAWNLYIDGTAQNYFAGNVGIGTTTPAAKLQVTDTYNMFIAGSGLGTGANFYSDNSVYYGTTGNNSANFFTNNLPRMKITNDGLVGIGTTSPGYMLDVSNAGSLGLTNKTAALTNSQSLPGSLNFSGYGWRTAVGSVPIDGQLLFSGAYNGGTGTVEPYLSFLLHGSGASDTTLSEKMRITNSGNVGINAIAPGAPLQIGTGTSGGTILYRGLILSGGWSSTPQRQQNLITFKSTNAVNADPFNDTTGESAKNFHIGLLSDTAFMNTTRRFSIIEQGAERFTVQSGGNVGIGTTAPTQLLEVYGTSGSTTLTLRDYKGSAGATANMLFGLSDGVFVSSSAAKIQARPVTGSTSALAFSTYHGGLTEDMTINAGNVGIGTTAPIGLLNISSSTIPNPIFNITAPASTNGQGGMVNFSHIGTESSPRSQIKSLLENISTNYQTSLTFSTTKSTNVLTEAMRIDSTGNVGIGTTAPITKLQVNSTTIGQGIVSVSSPASAFDQVVSKYQFYNSFSPWDIGWGTQTLAEVTTQTGSTSHAVGNLSFSVKKATTDASVTEIMRITNSGNVGIGTTNPGALLDVYGSDNGVIRISGLGASNRDTVSQLDFYNHYALSVVTTGQIKSMRGLNDHKAGQLGFFTSAASTGTLTERMTINEAGNVGIGTVTPEAKLDMYGGYLYISAGAGAVNNSVQPSGIKLGSDVYARAAVISNYRGASSGDSGIDFQTYGSAVAVNAMRILGNGNVGIGTPAPGDKLDVIGKGSFTIAQSAGINEALKIVDSANGLVDRGVKMGLYVASGVGANRLGAEISAANEASLTSSYLTFNTENSGVVAEKVRITGAGNVGIGTTTPSDQLEVAGLSGAYGRALVSDGMGAERRGLILASASAAVGYARIDSYKYGTGAGYLPLVLNSGGGNVGIGTTTPTAGKLQVDGNIISLSATNGIVTARSTGADGNNAYLQVIGGTSGADWLIGTNRSALAGSAENLFFYKNVAGTGTTGTKMMISADGNVGIGTTTPNANLELYQTSNTGAVPHLGPALRLSNGFADNGTFTWNVNSDYAGTVDFYTADTSSGGANVISFIRPYVQTISGVGWDMAFGTSTTNATATEKFRITGAGNVGIGTTTPGSTLPTGFTAGTVLEILDAGTNEDTGLFLRRSASLGLDIWQDSSVGTAYIDNRYANAAGNIYFRTQTNGTPVNAMTILGSGYVGIGTTGPNQQLEITQNFRLPSTTYNAGAPYGVIYKDGNRFIHNFNYGNNGTVTTNGNNTFVGINAGNLTMGSTATGSGDASNNTGVGSYSLYSNTTGGSNTAIGMSSLYSNTTGGSNTAIGNSSLYSNTTGNSNTANGYTSLYSNTTGGSNTAIGNQSLRLNSTGSYNTAIGDASLFSTTVNYNTAIGYVSLQTNTTGIYNTAVGTFAGTYINGGSPTNTTGDYNVFLGSNTKPLADNDQNEIVIGYDATGVGSNSVVLGNDSILTTVLKGKVGIGTTTPVKALDIVNGLIVKNAAGTTLTGTADPTASTTLLGTGTLFLSELSIGDQITINGEQRFITAIASNTSLTVSQAFTDTASASVTKQPAIFASVLSAGTVGPVINAVGQITLPNNVSYGALLTTGVRANLLTYNTSNRAVFGANSEIETAGTVYIKPPTGGNISIQGGATDGATAVGTTFSTLNNLTTAGAKLVSFQNLTTEKAYIDKDGGAYFAGTVGIGKINPMAKTEIYGAGQTTANITDAGARTDMLAINSSGTAAGSGGAILFGHANSVAAGSVGGAAIKYLVTNGANNTQGDLAFSTRNASTDTALTERMRITLTGSVGIGDDTPDAKLDVKGTVCLDLNADDVCTDNTAALSDSRLKTKVIDIQDSLSLV